MLPPAQVWVRELITTISRAQMEDALLLLRFNCPSTTCDYIASGWPDLRLHVRVDHTAELW
jgi:hypothetical protein